MSVVHVLANLKTIHKVKELTPPVFSCIGFILHSLEENFRSMYNSWLVGSFFCFTAYQPFSSHLMPNQVILIKTLF